MRLNPVLFRESNTSSTAPDTYSLAMGAVCVAAGVIRPRPVAIGMDEPTAIVRADLHRHFCTSKEKCIFMMLISCLLEPLVTKGLFGFDLLVWFQSKPHYCYHVS